MENYRLPQIPEMDEDCIIEKVCYSKIDTDLSTIPKQIVEQQAKKYGFKAKTLKKKDLYRVFEEVIRYQYYGEIPEKYVFENDQ